MTALRSLPALFILTLFILMLCACTEQAKPTVADQSVRPARIFAVTADSLMVQHEFVGQVEARQTIDVTFRVPGPLVDLPVLEGQTIPEGGLIAAIDDTDYVLAHREARVQLELAQQDLNRKRQLLSERGISRSLVDDAKALFDLRQVALEKARENLTRTRLTAPFQAYVARRFTDNHVNVRVGDPIVRLMDLNELYVVINIPENLVATTTPERLISAKARFPFLPEQPFDLTIRENRGESSAVAQTFEVTMAMARPDDLNILPGMTATVEVTLSSPNTGADIQIPTSALVSDPEKNYFVWLYDPDTQLVSRRTITIGPAAGAGITVLSGLISGDLIVASGASALQPGMKVRPLGEPGTGV